MLVEPGINKLLEKADSRYTLVIEFPIIYNNSLYENCIESIELIVDSKQIIK